MAEKNTQNGTGFKTRQQIANEYQISEKTLMAKLRLKGVKLPKGLVSLEWQKQIYEALGYPLSISKDDYHEI